MGRVFHATSPIKLIVQENCGRFRGIIEKIHFTNMFMVYKWAHKWEWANESTYWKSCPIKSDLSTYLTLSQTRIWWWPKWYLKKWSKYKLVSSTTYSRRLSLKLLKQIPEFGEVRIVVLKIVISQKCTGVLKNP